jgi:hypothetical protein
MGEESSFAQARPCPCVPESEDSIACVAFYSSKPWQLHCGLGPNRWPRDNLIYYIGSHYLGEANDVFNDMESITSCRPTTSLACAARRRVVGSLGTITTRLPRVVEPPCIVAIHREWVVDLRCTITVLQPPCSHVLLAFNAPPATRLAGVWCWPCRVALWKIRLCSNGRL